MVAEYTFPRPVIAWPADASLLGYEFASLLIDALHQGPLLAYLGWYVDSSTEGPVWHRWGKGEEGRIGVSLIVSVYALWSAGRIDVVVHPRAPSLEVFLTLAEATGQALPPLEQEILARLATSRLRPGELVESLPLPSRRRGIASWVVSGAPSADREGWYEQTSTFAEDAPVRVGQALELAKSLVVLEAGADLPEDEDVRWRVTAAIEAEIFDAVHKRP
jgi:hypothetical protein